jgi:retinol dehydrogenase-12
MGANEIGSFASLESPSHGLAAGLESARSPKVGIRYGSPTSLTCSDRDLLHVAHIGNSSTMASPGFFRPSMLRQNFPGAPAFTEKNIRDLTGKVFLITGANSGIGKELARLLYAANATVYMACRTETKARAAMHDIESAVLSSKGHLEFLPLDLGDLRSIKPAVEAFTAKESKLHVLFNNAGIMFPSADNKTAQGYDLELGTNCLGHFLLAHLLTPTLITTAKAEPAGAVRVVWVSSMAAELYSVRHGIDMGNLSDKGYVKEPSMPEKYGNSKAGNYLHGVEYARRYKQEGIVSVVGECFLAGHCARRADRRPQAINPGNLNSDLYRTVNDQRGFQGFGLQIFTKFMLHPTINGAYTELFAGLSDEVSMDRTGTWSKWLFSLRRFWKLVTDSQQLDRGAASSTSARTFASRPCPSRRGDREWPPSFGTGACSRWANTHDPRFHMKQASYSVSTR